MEVLAYCLEWAAVIAGVFAFAIGALAWTLCGDDEEPSAWDSCRDLCGRR